MLEAQSTLPASRADQLAHELSEAFFELMSQHLSPWFKGVVAEFELSPIQAKTLLCMNAQRSNNMSELAVAADCGPSNLTGVIDKLEARRLVERKAASEDRRVKRVMLTRGGAALRRRLEARLRAPAPWMLALSAADQRLLRDLLRKVVSG